MRCLKHQTCSVHASSSPFYLQKWRNHCNGIMVTDTAIVLQNRLLAWICRSILNVNVPKSVLLNVKDIFWRWSEINCKCQNFFRPYIHIPSVLKHLIVFLRHVVLRKVFYFIYDYSTSWYLIGACIRNTIFLYTWKIYEKCFLWQHYVHSMNRRFRIARFLITRTKTVLRNPFTRETKTTTNTIMMRDCNYNHRLQIVSQSYYN